MTTSSKLLGAVLREGCCLTGESPEAAGAALGMAGSTIRRLEAGLVNRPREVTLDALARYYNLDASVLNWLADCRLTSRELEDRVRERAGKVGVPNAGELDAVTVAWARIIAPPPADDGTDSGEQALLGDFRALDRRRQGLLRALASDLRISRAAELRAQAVDERPVREST
jgi:transcriptional regulator with XRE-family HTH domain